MNPDVAFQVIANVDVAPDGTLTMTLDWCDSLLGEFNESNGDHVCTPLAERVASAVDAYLVTGRPLPQGNPSQSLVIGKLEAPV